MSSVFVDSPPRHPRHDGEEAGCSTAPDSSTVCPSFTDAPPPQLEGVGFSSHSSSHTQPCAAISSTSAGHPPDLTAPPSPGSTTAHSPLPRSKPSSPSTSSPCPSPASSHNQNLSLGQRRKSLTRKVRRSQRQRGRQSCTPAARDEDRRATEEEEEEEEKMEEDVKPDEERMEEEASGESAAIQGRIYPPEY